MEKVGVVQYQYITPLPSIPNVTMITNEAKKKKKAHCDPKTILGERITYQILP